MENNDKEEEEDASICPDGLYQDISLLVKRLSIICERRSRQRFGKAEEPP
jgi:hypothetical protein